MSPNLHIIPRLTLGGSVNIRPTKEWRDDGVWSLASAAVHGISLEVIAHEGLQVDQVFCDRLNAILASSKIVATDAPRFDQDWLDTLFRAADREQQFTLYDFEVLTRDLDADQHRHLTYLLNRAPVPHRAGSDATRLASKLMEAHLGYSPRTESLEQVDRSSDLV